MSIRAGGVDWVGRWREMVAAAAAPDPCQVVGEDPWQHRAERFNRVGRKYADAGLEPLSEGLLGTDVVADIGAGTGRHALPISKLCARVIAIEPSAAMRAHLEAGVASERARISVISEPWPCAIEPVDLAYSCHVLYGVADAAEFLDQMTRAARRTCKLVLGLRAPAERIGPLWRAIHGVERPPRPAALEALALLHQLGHAASFRVLAGTEKPMLFLPNEDDLDDLCRRLRLPPVDPERARVRSALERLYPRASADQPWDLGVAGTSVLLEWPGAA